MIAQLEWRIALAQRRLFVLNVAIPLLLVAPVALGGAPRAHAAMVYTLLVACFGTFGAAIPLVRDAENGLFGRYLLAGVPPARLLGERVVAHATLDLVQLAPALGLALAAARAAAADAIVLLAVGALVLVAANAIGTVIATLARSIAEAALFAAVTALLLAHAGGVFRFAPPGSLAAVIAPFSPFAHLHRAVQAALGAAPSAGAAVPVAAGIAAVLSIGILAAAPALCRRVAT